jgi:hypothetical protein
MANTSKKKMSQNITVVVKQNVGQNKGQISVLLCLIGCCPGCQLIWLLVPFVLFCECLDTCQVRTLLFIMLLPCIICCCCYIALIIIGVVITYGDLKTV